MPERTLDSISFADEVLYIPVTDDFGHARNEGLAKAKNEWIFYIDSDEVVSSELQKELGGELVSDAYYISRRDFFWGRELKYGETQTARSQGIIRLVKKGSGKWSGKVHEVFEAKGRVGRLKGSINHYPHQTIAEFLASINEYSTLRAEELYTSGVLSNVYQILIYPFGKFWYTYIIKLGFLDGPAGFVYSFMMSFHSFLVRSKLYLANLEG